MKTFLLSLLIATQAFAGLPPTTLKGQSDATAKTKFFYQVPHNQATDLGGVNTLIETGNQNLLPDPGFEAATTAYTYGGVGSGSTSTAAKGTGAKGYDLNASGPGNLDSPQVTIPDGFKNKNGVLTCNIKNISGASVPTITPFDGTNPIVTAQSINVSTTSFIQTPAVNFVFPSSGTIGWRITITGSGRYYIDDCKITLADNVASFPVITPVVDETSLFTFTGLGTVGATKVWTNRIADKLHVEGFVTVGTPTAVTLTMNLPTKYPIDYTKQSTTANVGVVGDIVLQGSATTAFTAATTGVAKMFTDGSTTNAVFVGFQYSGQAMVKNTGSGYASASNVLSFKIDIPISGWSTGSAVSADQTDYDWTSYTPTFTGFGTPTSIECQHSRLSSNLMIRCKFTAGTTTATEARISLPSGLTSADTAKIPSIQVASGVYAIQNTSPVLFPLIEPSVTYITIGTQNGAANPLTKLNGSTVSSSSVVNSFFASIPIQGWSSNQRAPTLIGSVTSNATTALRLETAKIQNTGTCSIVSQSGSWLTSATINGTGRCDLVFQAFASPPTCTVTTRGTGTRGASINSSTTTTLSTWTYVNGTTNDNQDYDLICIGPR